MVFRLIPIFTRVSKVINIFFCFASPHLVIGLKSSRQFLDESEVRPKPIVTRSYTLSRASCWVRVFALSFDWFTGLSVTFVIGQSDDSGSLMFDSCSLWFILPFSAVVYYANWSSFERLS